MEHVQEHHQENRHAETHFLREEPEDGGGGCGSGFSTYRTMYGSACTGISPAIPSCRGLRETCGRCWGLRFRAWGLGFGSGGLARIGTSPAAPSHPSSPSLRGTCKQKIMVKFRIDLGIIFQYDFITPNPILFFPRSDREVVEVDTVMLPRMLSSTSPNLVSSFQETVT